MKRLLALAIAAALALLYVFIPDPFGVRLVPAPPPAPEEAPPSPADDPPLRVRPIPPERTGIGVETAMPTPPPQLTGRVTDLLGGALEGARVALHRAPSELAEGDTLYELFRRIVPPPTPLAVAVTDEAGAFTFASPPPGRYRVETTAPGRAIDILTGVELTTEAPGGEFDIRLAPGEPLAGRLVDTRGGAVPGGVILVRAGAGAAEPSVERTVTCDPRGRFRFPALPPGRVWRLLFRAEGYAAGGRDGIRLPQPDLELVAERGRAYRVAMVKAGLLEPLPAEVLVRDGDMPIAAGETGASGVFPFRGVSGREVTIHVQPQTYEAGLYRERLTEEEGDLGRRRLAVGRPVVGVVVDADTGRGLAGADVRADHAPHLGMLPPRWLRAGSHGEFTYAGYGGRGLALSAFRDGHAAPGAKEGARLAGWPARDVRLSLRRLGTARGRVVGPRGGAAAGAELRAIFAGRAAPGRVTSRSDGTFTLHGVPVGQTFRLVAWREGDGFGVSAPVRVDSAHAPARVHLALSGVNRLRGYVVDELGAPVAEARIRVVSEEEEPLLVAEAVSGTDGRFRVDGLGPGRFRLAAQRAGHAPTETVVASTAGAFPEAELRVRRLRELTGTVYFADRRPAAGVVIEARPVDGGEVVGWGLTGQNGTFELAVPGAGAYALDATARGGFTARATAVAGAGHAVLALKESGSSVEGER